MNADRQRRFGGIDRLHGAGTLDRFAQAHVCVVGIGGVGSWAAEALARCGVGQLTLIDLDHVAESNINRQVHATDENLGKAKTMAMAERIGSINPACVVRAIDDFITPENTAEVMAGGADVVIDAIDQVRAKVALIAHCRRLERPIVVAGGAGGKTDPTCIRIDDLSRTEQDPLLAKVRSQLRKSHGYSRDPRRRFGVAAVYSCEPLRLPTVGACVTVSAGRGLNCAGYGSSVCITASFGLFCAAAAMQIIRGER